MTTLFLKGKCSERIFYCFDVMAGMVRGSKESIFCSDSVRYFPLRLCLRTGGLLSIQRSISWGILCQEMTGGVG